MNAKTTELNLPTHVHPSFLSVQSDLLFIWAGSNRRREEGTWREGALDYLGENRGRPSPKDDLSTKLVRPADGRGLGQG